MQYKCQECNDTGSRDKIGAYFDCNACGTAAIRRDLNEFVKSLTQRSTYPVHPEDVALAIHQRALAMAPKQEAQEPVAEVSAMPGTSGFTMAVFKADDMPIGSKVYAAPAAANGALTDEQIQQAANEAVKRGELSWLGFDKDDQDSYTIPVLSKSHFQFARAILAAAGPDAALTDAKHLVDITTAIMSQHGLIDHLSSGATQAFCDDLCAALFGAKGN